MEDTLLIPRLEVPTSHSMVSEGFEGFDIIDFEESVWRRPEDVKYTDPIYVSVHVDDSSVLQTPVSDSHHRSRLVDDCHGCQWSF